MNINECIKSALSNLKNICNNNFPIIHIYGYKYNEDEMNAEYKKFKKENNKSKN